MPQVCKPLPEAIINGLGFRVLGFRVFNNHMHLGIVLPTEAFGFIKADTGKVSSLSNLGATSISAADIAPRSIKVFDFELYGSNSSYNCTPFLHSLLTKGKRSIQVFDFELYSGFHVCMS